MSARRPARTSGTARQRLIASAAALLILVGIVPVTAVGAADTDGQTASGVVRPIGPVRGGDGPRGRQDDVRPGWPRHRPVQATGERSLGGRWRRAQGPPGRPPVGQGAPRRRSRPRPRFRSASRPPPSGRSTCPISSVQRSSRPTWLRRSIRVVSSARSSASCRTGSCPTARPDSTGRSSRPSPTSGSGRPATATSRRRTATDRRRSAGAAGRAPR